MNLIPLSAVPNQTLSVTVNDQACQIAVRQNGRNLFFDLVVGGVDIIRSRLVQNKQRLCIDARYQPFEGDFLFWDGQGDTQPVYTGLGDRYQLYYLEPDELG